jgi:hypothetical protein
VLGRFVDPALRRAGAGDRSLVSPQQAALVRALAELGGEHERFEPPALGSETDWAGDALAEPLLVELRERAERAERSAREYAASRSYRATAPVRWAVGRLTALTQSRRRAAAQ